MAVVIETTLGDITVDLYLEQRPVTCLNFLKLCKMKYYNFNLFHSIRSGFIAQTGDPTGEGSGGESIFGLLEGPGKRFFSGEKMPKIRHTDTGLLSMVCTDDMMVGSQFFFTLGSDLDSLDGIHCVIGEVTEGHEVLRKLNDVICDETHRPYQDVRVTHTVVLEDPFSDPTGFRSPSRSPSPSAERLRGGRIAPDEEIDETQGKSAAEVQEIIEEKEAKARATILEIVGDIPDADIAPPENVLFVCKLNPVTTDEDLEIIFSRFGKIVSCEVIRDKKSGDSLQYAFIEFSDKKSCEDAYFKMDNVLIDDRRIHVDFSQSVSKIKWLGKGRGVKHLNDDNGSKRNRREDNHRDIDKRPRSKDRDDHRNRDHQQKDYSNRKRGQDRNKEREITQTDQDRRQREENKSRHIKEQRERSRSRSKVQNSRDKTARVELRHHKHHEYDKNEKYNNSHKHESHKDKNDYSNSHKSRSNNSPIKNNKTELTVSSTKKYKDRTDNNSQKDNHEKLERNNKNKRSNDKNYNKDYIIKKQEDLDKHKLTRKSIEDKSESKGTVNKKSKHYEEYVEPITPPVDKKDKKKVSKKGNESKKSENRRNKKKRRPSSSSSDTDTSDSSSSSSDSSSSSYDDRKKKVGRRNRKPSSSSSSSSSSSTSSSSTDSSTESSSSSSDSEPKKKRKKDIVRKKDTRKSKKKL